MEVYKKAGYWGDWVELAGDRSSWRQELSKGREERRGEPPQASGRNTQPQGKKSQSASRAESTFRCSRCHRDCYTLESASTATADAIGTVILSSRPPQPQQTLLHQVVFDIRAQIHGLARPMMPTTSMRGGLRTWD